MATGSKSSNHGASSSSSKKTVTKLEKRKQCAPRAEQAKKPRPRPFQLISFPPAHPRGIGSGTAVVPVGASPHHRGAINSMAKTTTAAALPFPIPGVNGAAPLWSTAATLGAASRAAAASTFSSPPATTTAGANRPAAAVIAPAPGQQPPPACAGASSNTATAAAVLPVPVASAVVMPPLVLAPAGAGGEFVPVPLHFVGYHPTCGGGSGMLPAPAVGIPLAAALDKIENAALGRMLSALTPACRPPLLQHQSKTGSPPPPWWPTGSEDWWGPELLAHLDTPATAAARVIAPVPFASGYSLRKAQKVAVLVAIVKHLAPDFARVAAAVRHSGKLSASETHLWESALNNERAKCMRPVFLLLPQPQQQCGGGGGTDVPSAARSVVGVHGGSAASGGCELQVANLPAAGAASVSVPADGSRGEMIAAAAAEQQPVNNFFPAGGDGGAQHEQGAAVVAPTGTGHVRQLVAGGLPEMTMMQQPEPEQHGGVPGNGGGMAAAEDDHQVQVHPPVVDGVEGQQWWHSEELNRLFAEYESFSDIWF